MDEQRFDAVIRRFATGETRRGVLTKLSLGGVGAALAAIGLGPLTAEDTEAAQNARKCKQRCRRRFSDNRGKFRRCKKKCKPGGTTPQGCQTDNDCKGARICAANQCVDPAACTSDAQCGPGRVCTGNSCVDDPTTCTSAAECGLGQDCVNGQCDTIADDCSPTGTCPPGQVCVPALNICIPEEAPCNNGACPDGQICVVDSCVELPDGQCQILGTSCEESGDCCDGLICLEVGLLGISLCLGL